MRTARTIAAGLSIALAASCAPIAAYRGPQPAPGAIRAFDDPSTATWFVAGSSDPARHHLGTLKISGDRDSLVLLVYGDNRPGDRMLTTPWGVNGIRNGFSSGTPGGWLVGLVNVPIALVQFVVPTLDGFQDVLSRTVTHRYSGGAEKQVLAALEAALPADLVVNTGDLVTEGRRGRQWEDYERRHRALRERVAYVAAVGNHEQTWSDIGLENWNAVMGDPAAPRRLWYSLDLGDGVARLVVLDGTVFTDPKREYPDSLRSALADEQLGWMGRALDVDARYKLVFIHYPLVTTGRHLSDWEADDRRPEAARDRTRLLTTLSAHGVTAVFAGHEHLYQQLYVAAPSGGGFWQVTTGGGGSPLYPLSTSARAKLRAVKLPAGFETRWPAEERAVYHYTRLALARAGGVARLTVHRVEKNGRVDLIDAFDLTRPPEAP